MVDIKCGICGNPIDKKNRWEIINHYAEDTIYGRQGVLKMVFTFCTEACMVSFIERNSKCAIPGGFYNLDLVKKIVYRRKNDARP